MWWLLVLSGSLQGPVSEVPRPVRPAEGLVRVDDVEAWIQGHPELQRSIPCINLTELPREERRVIGWVPPKPQRIYVDFLDPYTGHRLVGWEQRTRYGDQNFEYTDMVTGRTMTGSVVTAPAQAFFSRRQRGLLNAAHRTWPGRPLTWYEGVPVPADWYRNLSPYPPHSLTRPYLYPP